MTAAVVPDNSRALPDKVVVRSLVQSRYGESDGRAISDRPLAWDERLAGIDTVQLESGESIALNSDGQQSPPKAGWILLLTGGTAESGYTWTLYGMPASQDS